MALPHDIAARWRSDIVLKRDVFSIVERGVYAGDDGEVWAVLRRIDQVPWWSWPIARLLLAREQKTLAVAGRLGVAPPLHAAGRNALVRGWISGVTLHIAQPHGDAAYFRSARSALRSMHRAGVCHNDLAKAQNWLRGEDGRAYVTDFQLASLFRRRSRLFRLYAYEDLRHLLKHKQRYLPESITPLQRRILSKKSLLTRIWMATGKKVYVWITRGVFGFTDREGGGVRLVRDAPKIVERLKAHPQVRDAIVLAYPDARAGTGLYAFVEADGSLSEDMLWSHLSEDADTRPPELLQLTQALPRRPSGEIHGEILQLVTMNQVDLIDSLLCDERERRLMMDIVAERRNLRDRISF